MADVQYTTLYLPDGTPLSVVVGSQLQATLLATGATTSPVTRTAGTSSSTPAPDVRTPVATIWYSTPFGPQAIIDEHTQAEYTRRDYPVITAAQAAAYYATSAHLPDVSFVTGQELQTALAGVATAPTTDTAREAYVPARLSATALRAASVSANAVALAANPDTLIAGSITRDANGAATAAPVAWPDGDPGQYTATTVSTAFPGAVDAYKITKGNPVKLTFTQPAVTRNATGAVTQRPALQVA